MRDRVLSQTSNSNFTAKLFYYDSYSANNGFFLKSAKNRQFGEFMALFKSVMEIRNSQ